MENSLFPLPRQVPVPFPQLPESLESQEEGYRIQGALSHFSTPCNLRPRKLLLEMKQVFNFIPCRGDTANPQKVQFPFVT